VEDILEVKFEKNHKRCRARGDVDRRAVVVELGRLSLLLSEF
jgi:hypothetical protein